MSYCAIYDRCNNVTLIRDSYLTSGLLCGTIVTGTGSNSDCGKLTGWNIDDIIVNKTYDTIEQFLAEHFDTVL